MAQEPVPPLVRFWHANCYLVPMGRLEEAIGEYRWALQQDPLNAVTRHSYAMCLVMAGKLSESESELRQALEIDPRYFPSRYSLAFVLAHPGELAEALEQSEAAYAMAPTGPGVAAVHAAMLKLSGHLERSEDVLRKCRETPGFKRRQLLLLHLLTSETDKAADCLREAVEERSFLAAASLRFAQGVRPSPHWAEVARMMNLPE